MQPLAVIKALNIVTYMFPSLPHGHEARGVQQLALQCLKEGLHLGIIFTLSWAVHAVPYPVLVQQRPGLVSAIFDTTIRMEQQA